jgi:hypothetical protein
MNARDAGGLEQGRAIVNFDGPPVDGESDYSAATSGTLVI